MHPVIRLTVHSAIRVLPAMPLQSLFLFSYAVRYSLTCFYCLPVILEICIVR